MAGTSLRLHDGARVAVVGAGPAGTLFAHHLLASAREAGLRLAGTLCDGSALADGWACRMGAGVLAQSLVDGLLAAGIALPECLIQRRITGYLLEIPFGTLHLFPPGDASGALTVFRGQGPRGTKEDGVASLDRRLLDVVLREGVRLLPYYVRGIVPPQSTGDPVRLRLGGAGDCWIEADLVVGASGLNSRFPEQVAELGLGYQPPRRIGSIQVELDLGSETIDRLFGNAIAVYLLNFPGVLFAAVTPKRRYATVTLVGNSLGDEHLARFFDHPRVRRRLEAAGKTGAVVCRCRPWAVESAAVQPYGDRLVMIGDAAASRLYKNGLQSALVTAKAAASTAVLHGISKGDFARHYGTVCAEIAHDNVNGRFVFHVYEYIIERFPWVARRLLEVAAAEQLHNPPNRRPTCELLWQTLSGDRPYSEIRARLLRPGLFLHLLREGNAAR